MTTSTENLTSPKSSETQNEAHKMISLPSAAFTKSSRSVRPSKSMVKVRSLRPQRIELATKVRRKPIKA